MVDDDIIFYLFFSKEEEEEEIFFYFFFHCCCCYFNIELINNNNIIKKYRSFSNNNKHSGTLLIINNTFIFLLHPYRRQNLLALEGADDQISARVRRQRSKSDDKMDEAERRTSLMKQVKSKVKRFRSNFKTDSRTYAKSRRYQVKATYFSVFHPSIACYTSTRGVIDYFLTETGEKSYF